MSPASTLVNVSCGPAVHLPAGGTAAGLRAEAGVDRGHLRRVEHRRGQVVVDFRDLVGRERQRPGQPVGEAVARSDQVAQRRRNAGRAGGALVGVDRLGERRVDDRRRRAGAVGHRVAGGGAAARRRVADDVAERQFRLAGTRPRRPRVRDVDGRAQRERDRRRAAWHRVVGEVAEERVAVGRLQQRGRVERDRRRAVGGLGRRRAGAGQRRHGQRHPVRLRSDSRTAAAGERLPVAQHVGELQAVGADQRDRVVVGEVEGQRVLERVARRRARRRAVGDDRHALAQRQQLGGERRGVGVRSDRPGGAAPGGS